MAIKIEVLHQKKSTVVIAPIYVAMSVFDILYRRIEKYFITLCTSHTSVIKIATQQ